MLAALLFSVVAPLAWADSTCNAADGTCAPGVTGTDKYYWPMAMGHPNYYSLPPWPGPTDLQKDFAWSWFGLGKRYEDSFTGAVIDDKKNIYVNGHFHTYKLSPDGQLLWTYRQPGGSSGDAPVIYDGHVHGMTTDGVVFSVDMKTGSQKWMTKASDHGGMEYSQMAAHKGVLITQGDKECQQTPFPACSNINVRGLNTTDGAILWKYAADDVLWDWFPQFPDDESVIFMDKTGTLYKLKLQTGELIWKVGGTPLSWTDGSQFMAANDVTYTVEVEKDMWKCPPPPDKDSVFNCPGYVTAYKTSDGTKLWRTTVPKPPNTSPVVGRLGKDDKLTLLMPIGQQSSRGCEIPAVGLFFTPQARLGWLPESLKHIFFSYVHRFSLWLGDGNWRLWGGVKRTHDMVALDAETGEHLWSWSGPTMNRPCNPGDEDGFVSRVTLGLRGVCCPTPWGQPRIGSDGTIFLANEGGLVFALKDKNGNGKIDNDKTEESVYDTGATFPHAGTAHAPGMVVAVNFDGVFVWKS